MDEAQQKRYGWLVAIIFFFTWGLVFLDRLTISFTSEVLMQDLNLSSVQFSALTAVSTLTFAISSIVVGIISDRTGYRKKILVPFILIAGILSLCCSFSNSYTSILILRACVGFFEGPAMTLMMAILATVSFPGTFGRNAGIVGTGVAVLANTLGPVLITNTVTSFSWSSAFVVSGVALIAVSFVVGFVVKEVPMQKVSGQNDKSATPMGELFKNKNFVLCVLIGICCMVGYWTTMIFAPQYLTSIMGMSTIERGLISTIMGAIFIVIQLIVPGLSDKLGRKPVMIVSFIACVISPLSMWLGAGLFISVICYCIFGGVPGALSALFANVIPMESLPDNLKTSAGGIILGFSEIFGGFIWPLVASGVAESLGGIPMIMMIAAILLVICVLLSFALTETNPKVVAKKPV